jgi:hypothetical protein
MWRMAIRLDSAGLAQGSKTHGPHEAQEKYENKLNDLLHLISLFNVALTKTSCGP